MAKDFTKTATQIMKLIGGKDNVVRVTHCMTRLRFILKNENLADNEKLKNTTGVMGVMRKGGQYQIIIGNDVQLCYKEILKQGNFTESETQIEKKKEKLTVKKAANQVLDAITGTLSPVLPAILGCGLVKLINIILTMVGVPETNSTYQLLVILGDASFYFLPILVAASAAKRFGCNVALAMTVVAVLIHPNLLTMFAGDTSATLLGIPITEASYSSTVIPALLITWIMSYVERLADKVTPGWTKTIFKPLLVLLIMLPLSLLVLGPIGYVIGEGLQFALVWLQSRASWLTMMLLGAFMPLIVMTGMHQASSPMILNSLATIGFDDMILPAMLAANIAQGAACLAVSFRSKNKELKSVSGASALSAMVAGITEPGIYGVTLKLKRPMIAACIGGGVSGLFIGVVHLKSFALASPGLISIVQFISTEDNRNIIYAVIAIVISVVVTFIMTLVLGWGDPKEENVEETQNIIESPVPGKVIPLEQINDETFSSGMMGHGFGVEPSEGKVYAPFDGICEMLFDTKHALGLTSDQGVSLLIHVGLETVTLNGAPFTAHIATGDQIKKGQLLLEFDMGQIIKSGCETVTAVIVTNEDEVGVPEIQGNTMVIGGQ